MRSSWQGSPRSISDILLRFPQRKCWFFSPHISRKTFSYSAQASGMPWGNIKAWPQAERTLAELISVSINDLAWSDLSSWLFFFFPLHYFHEQFSERMQCDVLGVLLRKGLTWGSCWPGESKSLGVMSVLRMDGFGARPRSNRSAVGPSWHAVRMNGAAVSPAVGGRSYVCRNKHTFTISLSQFLFLRVQKSSTMCLYAEDNNI